MRTGERKDWMNEATMPILELLATTHCALPVGVLHYNLTHRRGYDVSRKAVLHALTELDAHDLVQIAPGSRVFYELTERGRGYLEEEGDSLDQEGVSHQ